MCCNTRTWYFYTERCRENIFFFPPDNSILGLTLYELWMGEVELAERMKNEENINNSEYKSAMTEAYNYLEESAK